ncbi:hypothetical protein M6B38_256420 [Iris pallida]|uniref:Uncharacterized protein n=1 Tax=Iris pallida TaxID=29817 RepID=A0AAX6DHD4_IRIPA|nr:hypothetical protein M6B38_248170 [Iris pallida]KAJ6791202.1 hypothetical protein M6B38_245445 [Iris pallida]KAJ6852076.1 hypothetical protein M6B38_256420 [Iris pallida]
MYLAPPSEIAKRTGMPFPLIARSEYRHMVLGEASLIVCARPIVASKRNISWERIPIPLECNPTPVTRHFLWIGISFTTQALICFNK